MQDTEDRKRWLTMLAELGLSPDTEPEPEPVPAPPVAAVVEQQEPVVESPTDLAEVQTPAVAAKAATEEQPTTRGRRRRTVAAEPAESRTKEATSGKTRRRKRTKATAATEVEASTSEEDASGSADALTEVPVVEISEPSEVTIVASRVEMTDIVMQSLGEEETNTAKIIERVIEKKVVTRVEESVLGNEEELAETGEIEGVTSSTGSDLTRRRRRRRRGGRRQEEDQAEVAALSSDDEEIEEEPSIEEDEVVAESPGDALNEDLDDDFEDLSNLNVPNWADLVASLYRPPDR